MNHLDYINYEDVDTLSDEEFAAFRNYLKFIGNRVDDDLGKKHEAFHDCVLHMNEFGSLTWLRNTVPLENRGGTKISLEEVKRMTALGMHSCK